MPCQFLHFSPSVVTITPSVGARRRNALALLFLSVSLTGCALIPRDAELIIETSAPMPSDAAFGRYMALGRMRLDEPSEPKPTRRKPDGFPVPGRQNNQSSPAHER
jgi:hypothetical protein